MTAEEKELPSAPQEEAAEQSAPDKGTKPKKKEKASQKAEELQAKITALSDEKSALNDQYLRIAAEYDNFRKRTQKEKDLLYSHATAAAVSAFLPAVDSFERALSSPCADAEYQKGMQMILTQLQESLKKLGVEEIEAEGLPFDPELHNAVMQVESETLPSGTVAQVLQKGYKLGDKVVRHAVVQVVG